MPSASRSTRRRAELECIADETGGEYHDAPDAEALEDLLPEIADRALRHYDVRGERASGATSIEEAAYLPPGQYGDRIDRETPHYYQVHVPEGATGHFAVVHVVQLDRDRVDSGVELRLVDREKRTCAENRGFREFVYEGPETASVSWTATENSRCDPGGPHFLEVTWDNIREESTDDIELLVDVEPRASGDEGAPADTAVEFAEPRTAQDTVWGGGSFNEAAALPGTGRYLDRVRYSEYSVYKVWLDWGQELSYWVTFLDGPAEGRATAVTELRGPTRAGLRDHWWKSVDYEGSAVRLGPVATPFVRYANGSGNFPSAANAGWYYLVVKLSPVWTDEGAVPSTQPSFELAVTVSGSPVAGPRYEKVSVPSSAPPVPTTRSTWTPSSSPSTSEVAMVAGGSSFPWWLLGGVVLLAVVVLAVLRRRSFPRR